MRAASRIAAEGGLLSLETTHAATAAAFDRKNRRMVERLEKTLQDIMKR